MIEEHRIQRREMAHSSIRTATCLTRTFVAACALSASMAGAQEADPGHFFRTVYDLYSRQMQVGDVKGLTDAMNRNLSPKFVYQDVHGIRMNGALLLAMISDQLHAVQKITEAVITPRKVWKDDRFTKVLTDTLVKFQIADQEGKPHDITAASTSIDTWFYRDGVYQLLSERSLSEKAWRDHKLFGSTQVEHWQAMIPRTSVVDPIPTTVLHPIHDAIESIRGTGMRPSPRHAGTLSDRRIAPDPAVIRLGTAVRHLEREVHSIQRTLSRKPWESKLPVRRAKKRRHSNHPKTRRRTVATRRKPMIRVPRQRLVSDQVPGETVPVQRSRPKQRMRASARMLPGKKRVIYLGGTNADPSGNPSRDRPKPNTSVNPG